MPQIYMMHVIAYVLCHPTTTSVISGWLLPPLWDWKPPEIFQFWCASDFHTPHYCSLHQNTASQFLLFIITHRSSLDMEHNKYSNSNFSVFAVSDKLLSIQTSAHTPIDEICVQQLSLFKSVIRWSPPESYLKSKTFMIKSDSLLNRPKGRKPYTNSW